MITESKRIMIEKYSKGYAKSFYSDFITHPEVIGPKFVWKKFPTLVSNLGSTALFTQYSEGEPSREEEILCKRLIKVEARALCNKHL